MKLQISHIGLQQLKMRLVYFSRQCVNVYRVPMKGECILDNHRNLTHIGLGTLKPECETKFISFCKILLSFARSGANVTIDESNLYNKLYGCN